jgi:hypothetical protein
VVLLTELRLLLFSINSPPYCRGQIAVAVRYNRRPGVDVLNTHVAYKLLSGSRSLISEEPPEEKKKRSCPQQPLQPLQFKPQPLAS